MPEQDVFEIRQIFSVIRRWWWLILCTALLAGITAYLVSSKLTPTYQASTTVLVQPGQNSLVDEYSAALAGQRLALTYSEMMKSNALLETVINRLGLSTTVEDFVKNIAVENVRDTQLIQVTVKDPSPEQAAKLADTIAEVFTTHIRTLLSARYTSLLENMQAKIDLLEAKIEETQAQIDTLNAAKNESQAKRSNLEVRINEYRTDYRSLEQDYQDIQLIISQIADQVSIIEAANVPATTIYAPFVATVKLLVKPITYATGSSYSADTYGEMLISRPVVEAAIAKLKLSETPDAVMKRLEFEVIPNTQLLQLHVTDTDRERATLLAGAITTAFLEQAQEKAEKPFKDRLDTMQVRIDVLSGTMNNIQQEIDTLSAEQAQAETETARLQDLLSLNRSDSRTLQQDYEQLRLVAADVAEAVIVSAPAQIPDKPVSPRPLRNTVMAAIAGILLAVGLAFLLEYLDDTIKTAQDISQKLGLSTIGMIGILSNEKDGLIVETQPRSPTAEAFRVLAANIRYASLDKPLKTLLVTSPLPNEGKTLVASNLAAAISQAEEKVIVVDADLRLPTLHNLFGLEQSAGLTESILKNSVDGNLHNIHPEHLSVMTSGEVPPNPTEVIGSQRTRSIMNQLTKKASIVILDSSPLLVAADATTLATAVDGVLLVFRSRQTTIQAAREAVEGLRQVNAKIVGVVLNAEARKKDGYYYYKYHDGRTQPVSRWRQRLNSLRIKLPRIPVKKGNLEARFLHFIHRKEASNKK
jgi:capsular exopolysaccharide synthesis family protein